MRRQLARVVLGLVFATLIVGLSLTAAAGTAPTVTALVEGRDVTSGQSTLVLVGKGMTGFDSFALHDTGGADVGPVDVAVRTSTMLVLRLPVGTPLASYDLVLGFGKSGQQVKLITLTNGTGTLSGTPASVSVVQSVPVEVTANAAPLPVSVSSIPPIDVATVPPVVVSSMPATTHIAQPLDSFVVLNLVNPTAAPIFVRSHEDGTQDAAEFVVPAGQRLVVTDVDWVVSDNALNYFHATLRLFVEKGANRAFVALFTSDTSNTATGGSGSFGDTWGSTGLKAGFVVGAGARVVADIRNVNASVSSGTTVAAFTSANVKLILRGYLAN